MSTYDFLKDFASPISTALAAITAATVAGVFAYRQAATAELQAKIALEKLKYDTMKDRLAIIEAVGDLIQVSVSSHSGDIVDGAQMQKHVHDVQKSRFYFRAEIVDYLNMIIDKSHDAAFFVASPDIVALNFMDSDGRQSYFQERAKRNEARKFLYKERNRVVPTIESDVALNFLKEAGYIAQDRYMRKAVVLHSLLGILAVLVIGLALSAVFAGR